MENGAGVWEAHGAGQGATRRAGTRLRTLAESVDGIIKTRRRRRSGGYSIHTSDRGGLSGLVSFSNKLARIGDIFSHKVGTDVLREMIEKELFEQETFILVHSVGQRE